MADITRTQPGHKSPFDQITHRFVLALALIPIVPASCTIVTVIAEKLVPAFDGFWWFHLAFTLFWMAGFILIWRTAIIWTIGRSALTTLVSLIPFVQIAFNKPLWTTPGCMNFNDELLRAGQHYSSCGIWTWLVVWIWWGLERKNMASQRAGQLETRKRSPWLARLGASLGMFPVIFGIFIILMVFFETILKMPCQHHRFSGYTCYARSLFWSAGA